MSDHVLCPHCGKKNGDLWDYEWGMRESVETQCGSCDQPIVIHRVVDVTYSVSAPKSGRGTDMDSPSMQRCLRAYQQSLVGYDANGSPTSEENPRPDSYLRAMIGAALVPAGVHVLAVLEEKKPEP